MKDEKELIQKCIDGDRVAMKQLFVHFYGKTMTTCNRYIDSKETAQDLAQEVMIKVFDHLKEFNFNSSLSTWITRITINQCLNFIKKKNIVTYIEEIELKDKEVYIEDELIDSSMNAEMVLKCIKLLPAGYRTILNLYAIEKYTHSEIANMLSISEGTSKSQLSKARQLLKKILFQHSTKIEKITNE
ncbi:MAG: RNA polymerase sigma factor [Bacteroidetes bacterium]|nr:RNA polymerase sigma factor [Bacteroidota bacterium]